MTAPGDTPTNQVGESVPEMKDSDTGGAAAPTDSAATPADDGSTTAQTPPATPDTTIATEPTAGPKFVVTEEASKEWIGRPVYSSDNERLGEIAALQRGPDGTVNELRADIGGFLGFGETRVRITSDQIQEVKDDSLVLTISEAEAKSLPAIDAE